MDAEIMASEIGFSIAEEVVEDSYYIVLDQKLWTQWRHTSEQFGFQDIEASREESQRFIQLLLRIASLLLPRVVCERTLVPDHPETRTSVDDVSPILVDDTAAGGNAMASPQSLLLAENIRHVELVDEVIYTTGDKPGVGEYSSSTANSLHLPADTPICIPVIAGSPPSISVNTVNIHKGTIDNHSQKICSIPSENQLGTKEQSNESDHEEDSVDQPEYAGTSIGDPASTNSGSTGGQHAGTSRRIYQCPHCPALVGSRPSLRHHIESRHSGGTYPCEVCSKAFASSILLYRHRRAVHTEETQQAASVCARCGKVYKTAASLKLHMKTAHEGLRFACSQCPKTYTTKHHLEAHVAKEHRRRERFLCSTCRRVYWSLAALKEHVKTHLPGRVFCEVCGKTFTYVRSLRAHMIAHSDEKNFFCDKCSQTFKRKSHLTRHLYSIHKDELSE